MSKVPVYRQERQERHLPPPPPPFQRCQGLAADALNIHGLVGMTCRFVKSEITKLMKSFESPNVGFVKMEL